MAEFIQQLKAEGIAEVCYIGGLKGKLSFPKYAQTPWLINGIGIIYGKK